MAGERLAQAEVIAETNGDAAQWRIGTVVWRLTFGERGADQQQGSLRRRRLGRFLLGERGLENQQTARGDNPF
ncbi:hypothetical protein CR152_18065 [Massilia violaceinigra]|uniref:Uncharacterized protein n=1 Tax=Massilia violaceinigra TaxID=2045208 RepID=A0A2D2DMN0_9BURK|nr:hypothetical protein CR152_18065 [Massilia violaceinigra]